LDMPRVEERLQRLSEEGDEPQQTCERWSKRSAFFERWCEFAVVVSRLNQLEAEAPTGNGEESTEEINELWRKRAELATEIVDAAVATVEEAIFKVTVTASLLSEGEIRVGHRQVND
jgi:shikimate kinase